MAKKISAKLNQNDIDLTINKNNKSKDLKKKFIFPEFASRTGTLKIEITNSTYFRFILFIGILLSAVFLWEKLLEIFVFLFFALIIASSVHPVIIFLIKKRVNKGLAIFIVYFLLVVLLLGSVSLVIVPFIQELQNLIKNTPSLLEEATDFITKINIPFISVDKEALKESFDTYFSQLAQSLLPFLSKGLEGALATLNTIAGIFTGIIQLFACIILSIYWVSDKDYLIDNFIRRFTNPSQSDLIRKLILDVEDKLGDWVRGQLLLSLIIGFFVWIVLTIFNVPFALPLAVLAGLMESVPSLGPVISAVPAVLIALVSGGPVSALLVAASYVIIQQLENNIIVPKIMSNAVGLRPIIVIIGLLIGFSIAGILGALFTVPILAVGKILLDFYFDLQKLKAKGIV